MLLHRCGNAETQIFTLLNDTDLSSGSFDPIILAQYYILGQGGSLNAIAKEATGVDFKGIQSTVTTTIADIHVSSAYKGCVSCWHC